MATLALGVVGAAIGGAVMPAGFSFLGATLTGAVIGKAFGTLAGAYIDSQLFGASGQSSIQGGPRLSDLTVTVSTEGTDIARLYGRAKLGGQIIWATNFEEEVRNSGGSGKGLNAGSSGSSAQYQYFANFAVGIAEGEVTRLGRVWADGDEINLADYTYRFYTGSEGQLPDSLIEAKEGAGNAPAYRGLAYIVFERLPLKDFGNRIPQLAFEVFRAVDTFEAKIKAVTMIPAAGEFAYHPTEVRVDGGGGLSYSANRHTSLGPSDYSVSLDQLGETAPNCAAVSLFVAWFGEDLRCATCTIKPKIEHADKNTTPISWSVAGLTRATADAVSLNVTRPAYGGTPTDQSVVAAIQDMRDVRGLSVIYTPFILMDIDDANGLTDPYTGAADQPAFPWRGRITCSPAPGESGTPDKTAAAATQVDAFYGTVTAAHFSVTGETITYTGPDEWSYSRFVLYNAALCKAAGGVSAFIIGSELRGLGYVRDSASTYPFVAKLASLAAQVAILLPSAQLTYAADWSEYFGHQPADGSGDVFFHLDSLWADANIDAVGIDNYWPLADWRDGTGHLDYQAGTRFTHDLSYLKGNIEGGEGFDFYYASEADRAAQIRTPIADGAYGKPWVYRVKGLRDWWGSQHYNRPGGVESGTPTAWLAQHKPIWFTELGCPAIDKAANQPNVFYDPKSAESAFPYFSRGVRDDLIQRRFLRAFLEWYDPADPAFVATQNPATTTHYTGRMVDTARIMIYTWDARPYPNFPAMRSIWSDGDNWQLGHWLTGRVSDAPLSETISTMMADYGFADYDAGQLAGSMSGYVIDRVMSAREAIQPLEMAFFFDSYESQGQVRFGHRGRGGNLTGLTPDQLVERSPDQPRYEIVRGQEGDLPRVAKVTYIDADREYEQATAEGRRISGNAQRVSQARLPLITTYQAARGIAETLVQEAWASRERANFVLPPSRLAFDASDVVTLAAGGRNFPLRLTGIGYGEALDVEALSIELQLYDPFAGPSRLAVAPAVVVYGAQIGVFLDLPMIRGDEVPYAGAVAAFGAPWPGSVAFYRSPSTSGYEVKALPSTPAKVGLTTTALYSGPVSRWDRGNILRVAMANGELASADEILVLGGSNIAAVQNADGECEVIQFATATLVSAGVYDLTGLLRGQYGTEGAIRNPVAAGARFVMLDAAVVQVDMLAGDVGLPFNWKFGPAPYDIGNTAYSSLLGFAFAGIGLRPLAPCHVVGRFSAGDLLLSWVRRTRISGDSWDQTEVPLGEDAEAYEIDVMNGAAVVRTLAVTSPAATYTAAQQTADFGAPQSSYTVRVYQISASYGRGARATAVVPA